MIHLNCCSLGQEWALLGISSRLEGIFTQFKDQILLSLDFIVYSQLGEHFPPAGAGIPILDKKNLLSFVSWPLK